MSNFKKVNEILKRNEVPKQEQPYDQVFIYQDMRSDQNAEPMQQQTKANAEAGHEKGKKTAFYDDGRSIVDMNVEGFSWYTPNKYRQERENLAQLKITPKEKLAMIGGALAAILPIAIMMMLLFLGAFLLINLWLN